MKVLFSILLPVLCGVHAFAQKQIAKSEILTDKEVASTFGDAEKKDLELIYHISTVYKYSDKSGQFYTILMESRDSIRNQGDTYTKIRAVTAKYENGRFINLWEVNDFADKKKEEQTIWFWTNYTEFKDYDHDSEMDAVIVYGTTGINDYPYERIGFVIYYKGHKILLQQNGQGNPERQLQIDKAFYSLPEKLQNSVREKMELMVKNDQAIFPHGWQKAMADKKTLIKELN